MHRLMDIPGFCGYVSENMRTEHGKQQKTFSEVYGLDVSCHEDIYIVCFARHNDMVDWEI